jgi:hypothetical protein
MRAALAAAAACQGRRDARGFAVAIVRGLQAGVAARLAAEEQAMTRSDVERVLPGADRARLDALFVLAQADRFARPGTSPDAEARRGRRRAGSAGCSR